MPLVGDYEPSPRSWTSEQVEAYEASGGRRGNTLKDVPVVIVTSRGARTGKLRKNPLMRVERGGRYAIVASNGGTPENPVWYHNLKADPRVELQDGPEPVDMVARELDGDERAEWWRRATEVWPDYDNYQTKTDRQIPVFLLEPAK
jgi:F420H(2)-dependent quinone reductase